MTSTAGSPAQEPEAGIRLEEVGRAFGPTVAVSGVSLTLPLHGHRIDDQPRVRRASRERGATPVR